MRDFDDTFIRRVSDELRAPVRLDPGFDARVMAAVRADAAPGWRRSPRAGWLLRPRTVRISPLAGLALAAGVAGVALVGTRAIGPAGDPRRGSPPASIAVDAAAGDVRVAAAHPRPRTPVPTTFHLNAPGASSVALIGEFNDWDPDATPLRPSANGRWEASVVLPAGRYEYAFVVDGQRIVSDPASPQVGASDFGTPNSVVTVEGGLR